MAFLKRGLGLSIAAKPPSITPIIPFLWLTGEGFRILEKALDNLHQQFAIFVDWI